MSTLPFKTTASSMNRFLLLLLFPLLGTASLHAGLVIEQMVITTPCEAGQAVVIAEIPFRVEGQETLRIEKILTSCNCTVGEADAPAYAPNAKGKINLTFTVGERVGFQRKTITIRTSDGQEHVAFFQTIVPAILKLHPAFLLWRKGSQPEAKAVTIDVALPQSVEVTEVISSAPEAFTTQLTTLEKGKRYTLSVTPKTTDNPLTARLVLKSSFPADDTERFIIVAAVK